MHESTGVCRVISEKKIIPINMEFTIQSEEKQESTNIITVAMDIDKCFNALLKSSVGHSSSEGESSIHGITCESVPVGEHTYSNVSDSWTNVDDDEEWMDIGEALKAYNSDALEPPRPNLQANKTSKVSDSSLIENSDHENKICHTDCQDTQNNECKTVCALKTTGTNMNWNCHIPLIIKNVEDFVVFCNENYKENSQPVRDENLSSLGNNTNQVEYHRKHLDSNSVADHRKHLISGKKNASTKMQDTNIEINCCNEATKHVSKNYVQSEKDCRSQLTSYHENVQENKRDVSLHSIYENGVKINNNTQTKIDTVIDNDGYMTCNAASGVWPTIPAIDVQHNNVNRITCCTQSIICHHSANDDILVDAKFQDALQTCTVFQTCHGNVSNKNVDKCAKTIGGEVVTDNVGVTDRQTLEKTSTCQEQNVYDIDSQTRLMNNSVSGDGFINNKQGSMDELINNNQKNPLVNNNTDSDLMSGNELTHFSHQTAHNPPENVRNGYMSLRNRKTVKYAMPCNYDSDNSDERTADGETDDSYDFSSDDRSLESSTDTDDDYITDGQTLEKTSTCQKQNGYDTNSQSELVNNSVSGDGLINEKPHAEFVQNSGSLNELINNNQINPLVNNNTHSELMNGNELTHVSPQTAHNPPANVRNGYMSLRNRKAVMYAMPCNSDSDNSDERTADEKTDDLYDFNSDDRLKDCKQSLPGAYIMQQSSVHCKEKPRSKCPYCMRPIWKQGNTRKWRRHIEHCKKFSFYCKICYRGFKYEVELDNHTSFHLKSSPNKKEDKNKCHICECTYAEFGILRRHLRHVHGKVPYNRKKKKRKRSQLHVCEICGKLHSHFKMHLLTHTDQKDYQCDICGFKCKRHDNLITHRRMHTGEKPFECDICGKTFTRGDNMKNHIRKMHS